MSDRIIPNFTRSEFVNALVEQVFELEWGAEASAKLITDVLRILDGLTFKEEEEK
jgi:hypothetical protein